MFTNSMNFTDSSDILTIQDYEESWWISIHHSSYIISILGHSRCSVCCRPWQALITNPSQRRFQFLLNITFMHLALQLYNALHRLFDSWWCHWGFFPSLPPTKPCALGSIQPLKMSTRDFSWGKGGWCVWLTTCHPCSAERQENPGP